MGATFHSFCSGSCTVSAIEAGAIPQIEGELLTGAIDFLEKSAIDYRGHAQSMAITGAACALSLTCSGPTLSNCLVPPNCLGAEVAGSDQGGRVGRSRLTWGGFCLLFPCTGFTADFMRIGKSVSRTFASLTPVGFIRLLFAAKGYLHERQSI